MSHIKTKHLLHAAQPEAPCHVSVTGPLFSLDRNWNEWLPWPITSANSHFPKWSRGVCVCVCYVWRGGMGGGGWTKVCSTIPALLNTSQTGCWTWATRDRAFYVPRTDSQLFFPFFFLFFFLFPEHSTLSRRRGLLHRWVSGLHKTRSVKGFLLLVLVYVLFKITGF